MRKYVKVKTTKASVVGRYLGTSMKQQQLSAKDFRAKLSYLPGKVPTVSYLINITRLRASNLQNDFYSHGVSGKRVSHGGK